MRDDVSGEEWMLRAAACELLALSLRYPDVDLACAVASGEWADAAEEVASGLGLALPEGFASDACLRVENAENALGVDLPMREGEDDASFSADGPALLRALQLEATRLLVGAPEPACSPYEGVWRVADDGVEALLFVNPHSMDVERFCRACGLGRPEGTNEPLDHAATELELLQHLAILAGVQVSGGEEALAAIAEPALPSATNLPGGSPAAAYAEFLEIHAGMWMPRFAAAMAEQSSHSFYRAVGRLLKAFLTREGR